MRSVLIDWIVVAHSNLQLLDFAKSMIRDQALILINIIKII